MGKSSAFSYWERTYFAGAATTLADAARRFGFMLVMLPVRHYAALSADASRPELWVIEAVRRRFEYFGLTVTDLGLVEAMLRAGSIALALDGMSEADRDTALTVFAQSFPAGATAGYIAGPGTGVVPSMALARHHRRLC